MKSIAIIGSGNIGSNLARLLAPQHHIILGSRNPEQTRTRLPGFTITDYATAAKSAEVVVLAIPFSEVKAAADQIGNMGGKTLIDVTNPLTADFMALTIGHTTSAGEFVQAAFPQARVVKAFNTILAPVIANAAAGVKPLPSVLIAGDHAECNAEVVKLAREAGFRAFDTGGLVNARYLEPLAVLGIQLAYAKGHGAGAGFSLSTPN